MVDSFGIKAFNRFCEFYANFSMRFMSAKSKKKPTIVCLCYAPQYGKEDELLAFHASALSVSNYTFQYRVEDT